MERLGASALASNGFLALEALFAMENERAATEGWGSLVRCRSKACGARASRDGTLAMLELGTQVGGLWKSEYKFKSVTMTADALKDHITRVHRWEGFMQDPNAPYRSGYLNASYFYQKPYILGYMGKREVVYFGPPGFKEPNLPILPDTSTMGQTTEAVLQFNNFDPSFGAVRCLTCSSPRLNTSPS